VSSSRKSVRFSDQDETIGTTTPSIEYPQTDNACIEFYVASDTSSENSRPPSHDSLTVRNSEGTTPSREGLAVTKETKFGVLNAPANVLTRKDRGKGPVKTDVLQPTTHAPTQKVARNREVAVGPAVPLSNRALACLDTATLPSRAHHSPSSSTGTDKIYFSPIDSVTSEAFLSSPQLSPSKTSDNVAGKPLVKVDPKSSMLTSTAEREDELPNVYVGHRMSHLLEASKETASTAQSANTSSEWEPSLVPSDPKEMVETSGAGKFVKGEKLVHTLEKVDLLAVRLASSAIVHEEVYSASKTYDFSLPLPLPVSVDGSSGVAVIAPTGRISITSSQTTLKAHTLIDEPHPDTAVTSLHILRAPHSTGKSKIVLQSWLPLLFISDKVKSRPSTLLTETDMTLSFASAALHELAATVDLSFDDIEIATPKVTPSPDFQIS
jgi:hypothetical protein